MQDATIAHVKMTSDRPPSAIRLHKTDAGGSSVRFPAQGASLGLLIDEATHDPGRTHM